MIEYLPTTYPQARWPNFSFAELKCRHTGRLCLEESSMDRLQRLRTRLGFALPVISGFRHRTHPIEAAKPAPGAHSLGQAFDIRCHGPRAFEVLRAALEMGFTGIGINQRLSTPAEGHYLHLDDAGADFHAARPCIWSY